MSSPVTHAEIMGPDRAALVAFYSSVFGWKMAAFDEMNYTIFQPAGEGIGGGIGSIPDGSSYVTLYAEVDSLEDKIALAKELGSSEHFGPMDVGENSRIAVVKDPAGNVFGLYQGATEAERPEGTGPAVSWFDIIGADPKALVTFYQSLLDWKLDEGGDGYFHVSPSGQGIGGGISAGMPSVTAPAVLLYITSENLEATLGEIEKAGGSTVSQRQPVGERIEIALFKDPAGNINGLVEYQSSQK